MTFSEIKLIQNRQADQDWDEIMISSNLSSGWFLIQLMDSVTTGIE